MNLVRITYLDRNGDTKEWEVYPIGISFTQITNTNSDRWILTARSKIDNQIKNYLLENILAFKEL